MAESKANRKEQHDRCCESVAKALKTPMVRFMIEALHRSGCTAVDERYFQCEPCGGVAAGAGFQVREQDTRVVVCEDKPLSQRMVDQSVTHELIHAFDRCHFKIDLTKCEHLACTEIRASSLSGECDWRSEFDRGNFSFRQQHQACVKRRAALSCKMNPVCAETDVEELIDKDGLVQSLAGVNNQMGYLVCSEEAEVLARGGAYADEAKGNEAAAAAVRILQDARRAAGDAGAFRRTTVSFADRNVTISIQMIDNTPKVCVVATSKSAA